MSVLKNSVNKTNLGAGSFQRTVNHSLSITYSNSDSSFAVVSLSAVSSSPKFLFVFSFLRRCIIEIVHSK